ncbi:transporter, partial [Chakrabartia godavariana]
PAKTVQLLATYGRDISVRSGFRESNRLNLRLLKVF